MRYRVLLWIMILGLLLTAPEAWTDPSRSITGSFGYVMFGAMTVLSVLEAAVRFMVLREPVNIPFLLSTALMVVAALQGTLGLVWIAYLGMVVYLRGCAWDDAMTETSEGQA